jgi:hypothetical protein
LNLESEVRSNSIVRAAGLLFDGFSRARLRGDASLWSSLAWQWFLGCVSVAEIAVFVLGGVLLIIYVETLWRTRRATIRAAHRNGGRSDQIQAAEN